MTARADQIEQTNAGTKQWSKYKKRQNLAVANQHSVQSAAEWKKIKPAKNSWPENQKSNWPERRRLNQRPTAKTNWVLGARWATHSWSGREYASAEWKTPSGGCAHEQKILASEKVSSSRLGALLASTKQAAERKWKSYQLQLNNTARIRWLK
jgi:hypothetical protein